VGVKSCSILTTTPNAVTPAVHDRMPVILDCEGYNLWLDRGMTTVEVVSEILKPYDAKVMGCYPVSTRINHVTNDDGEAKLEHDKQLFHFRPMRKMKNTGTKRNRHMAAAAKTEAAATDAAGYAASGACSATVTGERSSSGSQFLRATSMKGFRGDSPEPGRKSVSRGR
jgi:hypothetical protein